MKNFLKCITPKRWFDFIIGSGCSIVNAIPPYGCLNWVFVCVGMVLIFISYFPKR